MNSIWRNIAMNVLNTTRSEDITAERVSQKIAEYPYFSALPFLKTLLLEQKNTEVYNESVSLAAVYFQNPIWFEHQLIQAEREPDTKSVPEKKAEIEVKSEETPTELAFEPLHTVDYFASQGIKAPKQKDSNDQLSVKLKSFTDWLKTMKKIHPEQMETTINQTEEEKIRVKAEESNVSVEVYSETLADVYLKQGLTNKAIEVFEKLSLLDPAKSTYFASRISELK